MNNHNYDWRHPKKFGLLIDSDWFKAADDLKNGTLLNKEQKKQFWDQTISWIEEEKQEEE